MYGQKSLKRSKRDQNDIPLKRTEKEDDRLLKLYFKMKKKTVLDCFIGWLINQLQVVDLISELLLKPFSSQRVERDLFHCGGEQAQKN